MSTRRLDKTMTKQSTPQLIDAQALGDLLGLASRTIRRYDVSGRLPRPIHLGGAVRWRLAEIENWIEAGCPDRRTWETLKNSA